MDRPRFSVQAQFTCHEKLVAILLLHAGRMKFYFGKSSCIENLWAKHLLLNLRAFVGAELRIQHSHLANVNCEFSSTGDFIHGAGSYGRAYLVIVSGKGEQAGTINMDRQY